MHELNYELPASRSTSFEEISSPAGSTKWLGEQYHFVDDFLRLIFPAGDEAATAKPIARLAMGYHPLPLSRLRPDTGYHLPDSTLATRVGVDSPAIEVMTDLRRFQAVTIGGSSSVNEANQTMITCRVRALFVIDDRQRVAGIVTATDVLGTKPVLVARQRGILHDEVSVRDIMTPLEKVEVVDLSHVLKACVGDVVATLKHSGRQHALVVDQLWDSVGSGRQMVRGIFSLTQIVRQLGDAPYTPEEGHSFAEIATAIGP